jgi:hypothetical protein
MNAALRAIVMMHGNLRIMVALRGDRRVAMADVLCTPKPVNPLGERVAAARAIGTVFGDEKN